MSEKLKQYSGNFPESEGIGTAFRPGRGEFEQKFSKNSNARGAARGDVEASIDWYITVTRIFKKD